MRQSSRLHLAPEYGSGEARAVGRQAPKKRDVLLARLAVDADALDQNGLEAGALVVALTLPRVERLRTVGLPSNVHAVVYQISQQLQI